LITTRGSTASLVVGARLLRALPRHTADPL
jgi:hypothetical protein